MTQSVVPYSPEGRIPPQAVDVEMAVDGACLLDREALPKAIAVLGDRSPFYKPANGIIFEAMISLFERNEPIDLITLINELKRRGELEQVGGEYYLTELTTKVTSAANVEYHAHIVLEKAIQRQLITVSSGIIGRAYNETEDALELLDDAEQQLYQISEQRLKRNYVSMSTAVTSTMELLESVHGKRDGVTGVPSGFMALDSLTGGFQKSDLIIVAGRPSQGKTAFVLDLSRNAALLHEVPIGVFSLEMSVQALLVRMIAAQARVDVHALRTGRLPEDDWKKVSMSVGKLYKAKIFIDDTAAISVRELRAKARRLKKEHHIGMVVVDYLQLMTGPASAQNREQEIAQISRSLKALAKELDIPVIALSQLNRAVEQRADKRPALADLRESGAIEQDADVVVFVHRPEMYGIAKDENGEPTEGIAEIIVGKQRNGPTGIAKLTFMKSSTRFGNLAPMQMLLTEPPPAPEDKREMPF